MPTIISLTPGQIAENLSSFLAIAADVDGEYWTKENFLRDLPDKWRLSFACWLDGRLVGYAILSRKGPAHIHLHHFMVAAEHRDGGHGSRMAEEIERRARAEKAPRITLKVRPQNVGARRFYAKLGYRELGPDADYLVLEKHLGEGA